MTEFNIDPETINKFVAEKIIESSIGVELKKRIDEVVHNMANSYKNPYDGLLKHSIQEAARAYVETPAIKDQIKAAVNKKLEDGLKEDILNKTLEKLTISFRDY